MDFSANDVGFVSTMVGHYVQNTGDEDMVFLELFVASEFQDISLNKWLRALPRQAAIAHTNLEKEALERSRKSSPMTVPLFALCPNGPQPRWTLVACKTSRRQAREAHIFFTAIRPERCRACS
jgi:hypothetical protein